MVKIFKSKIVTGLLLMLVGWLVISDLKIWAKHGEVKDEMQDVKANVERLKKENDFLSRLQNYFKSESFLEQQARLKLNYKDADETVVFVYPNSISEQNTMSWSENSNLENYQKWWYYLMSPR